MALTKISRGLLDTGVSDSSDATAITIDSSEKVGLNGLSAGDYWSSSNQLVFGNTASAANGGMTIATATNAVGQIYFADGTSGNAQYRGQIQYTHVSDAMDFATAATFAMRIDSSGDVGIGTTLTSAKFNVGNGSGNAQLEMGSGGTNGTYFESIRRDDTSQSVDVGYYARGSGDHKFYTGTYTVRFTINETGGSNGSDEKLKKDIENISYGLDTVKSLQPRKFKWKETDNVGIGFIAQEVESLIPEVVSDTTDVKEETGEVTKVLNYANLTAVLTKAVQELSAKVEELESKINE